MNYLVKRSKRMFSLLLLTIFLFLFSACGLPSFLNLDYHISWVTEPEHESGTTIAKTFTVDAEGRGKIANLVTFGGPGVKLFYHLNDSTNHQVVVQSSSLNIRSSFNTHVRGDSSLNGRIWYPQSTAAPGFYIYSSLDQGKRVYSSVRPDNNDVNTNNPAALIGTFAFETISGNKEFRSGNEMDIMLPANGTLTLNFTLNNDNTVKLHIDNNLNVDNNLYTYHKESFSRDNLGLAEDALYLESLKETESLYLHIFASLYGGKGNFSNTYWSELEYLGHLKLE